MQSVVKGVERSSIYKFWIWNKLLYLVAYGEKSIKSAQIKQLIKQLNFEFWIYKFWIWNNYTRQLKVN